MFVWLQDGRILFYGTGQMVSVGIRFTVHGRDQGRSSTGSGVSLWTLGLLSDLKAKRYIVPRLWISRTEVMDVTKPVGVLISPSSTPPTRRVPLPEVRPNSSLPAGPRTAVNAFPSASPPAPSITPPAGPLSFEPLASHSATPPPPLGPAVGDVAPGSSGKVVPIAW